MTQPPFDQCPYCGFPLAPRVMTCGKCGAYRVVRTRPAALGPAVVPLIALLSALLALAAAYMSLDAWDPKEPIGLSLAGVAALLVFFAWRVARRRSAARNS